MQRNKKIICFVAGHSGGHIIPCLTLAKQYSDTHLINFIVTTKKLDSDILNHKNINKCLRLNLNKIPVNTLQIPGFLINLLISFFKSLFFLSFNRPKKLITTGGLIAIAPFIAAKILRIKSEIYELNIEPGKATTFLSRICKNINVCFPETQKYFQYQCTLVNYPIKFTIEDKEFNKLETFRKFNLSLNCKTILILGGSQGSLLLNNIIKNFINQYKPKNIQFIHQIGINDNIEEWKKFYRTQDIRNIIFSYIDDLKDFYNIADLVLCRSGAGTLAETMFFNKKCITIPLKTETTNHQILNAKVLEKRYPEKIKVVEDNNIKPLLKALQSLDTSTFS